jgi:hypothetical protein
MMALEWLGQADILKQLPSCYSAELDACIDAYRTKQPAELSAFCSRYYDLWKNTPEAAWNAAMDKMPICATAPVQQESMLGTFLLIGFAGLALGFAAGRTGQ